MSGPVCVAAHMYGGFDELLGSWGVSEDKLREVRAHLLE
jgi:hypothetical protein